MPVRLDAFLKWFMPREERFRELLSADTQNLLKAARLFVDIAGTVGTLEDRNVRVVQLKAVEHEGDQITRQVFEALNSTFITPFDREDIRSIAMDIDDVLDALEGVAQHLILFELNEAPEALRHFAAILLEMTEQIGRSTDLVWDMANAKKIQEAVVRISELENQADSLYGTMIASLFKGDGHSPTEIMKWKVVYDGLEDACDLCKDFTHVLGNVVLKNA